MKVNNKTSWFPNKGSSWVFENWVAPKLEGHSGLYKMGDSDILWSGWQGQVGKVGLSRLEVIKQEKLGKKGKGGRQSMKVAKVPKSQSAKVHK